MNKIKSKKLFFLNGKKQYPIQDKINNIKGLIVPHAGLYYSGEIANQGYGKINWNNYKRILILSTHHRDGTFTPNTNTFQLENKVYSFNNNGLDIIPKSNQAFELEHSWLVQLPFIQKRDNITIILINQYDENIFSAILSIVEEDTLVIANTDLLHCGPNYGNNCPINIKEYNEQTVDDIIKMRQLNNKNMCGKNAVEIFRRIAVTKGWNIHSKYYT